MTNPSSRKIMAWAVFNRNGKLIGYQNYENEPNDVLLRICETRKQAKQLTFSRSHIVLQVEIRPIKKQRGLIK